MPRHQRHSVANAAKATKKPLSTLPVEWSAFPFTENNWSSLQKLVHKPDVLLANTYMLDQYEESWFRRKQKCEYCKVFYSRVIDHEEICLYHTGEQYIVDDGADEKIFWSCCQTPYVKADQNLLSDKSGTGQETERDIQRDGCTTAPIHIFSDYHSPHFTIIEQIPRWKLFPTPPVPSHSDSRDSTIRFAVALDCEMGGTIDGTSELLRVSLIDVFTSEVLIDSLVKPSESIVDWRTQYSGVSKSMIDIAVENGIYLDGRDAAREAIWRFVSPETVVVAHAGFNDLNSLRWIHTNVIDTCLVEKSRKDRIKPASLKNLTRVILGMDIQVGKKGHDSIEDAMATRELAIWYARYLKDEDRVASPKPDDVKSGGAEIPQDSVIAKSVDTSSGAKSPIMLLSAPRKILETSISSVSTRTILLPSRKEPTAAPSSPSTSSKFPSTKYPRPTFTTSDGKINCMICNTTMAPKDQEPHARGIRHRENMKIQDLLAQTSTLLPKTKPAAEPSLSSSSGSILLPTSRERSTPTFIICGDKITCTICNSTMTPKDRRPHTRGQRHRGNCEIQPALPAHQWWCVNCKISMAANNRASHLAGKRHMYAKEVSDAEAKKKKHDRRRIAVESEDGDDDVDYNYHGYSETEDQYEARELLYDISTQWGCMPEGGAYGIELY